MELKGKLLCRSGDAQAPDNQVARFKKNLLIVAGYYDDIIRTTGGETSRWSSPIRQAALKLHEMLHETANCGANRINRYAESAWADATTLVDWEGVLKPCYDIGADGQVVIAVERRDKGESASTLHGFIRPHYDKMIKAAWETAKQDKDLTFRDAHFGVEPASRSKKRASGAEAAR